MSEKNKRIGEIEAQGKHRSVKKRMIMIMRMRWEDWRLRERRSWRSKDYEEGENTKDWERGEIRREEEKRKVKTQEEEKTSKMRKHVKGRKSKQEEKTRKRYIKKTPRKKISARFKQHFLSSIPTIHSQEKRRVRGRMIDSATTSDHSTSFPAVTRSGGVRDEEEGRPCVWWRSTASRRPEEGRGVEEEE